MDLLLEFIETVAQGGVGARYFGECLGETGAQDARVGSRAKHSGTKSELRDAVAMGVRDALDDPVQAKSAELVGHLAACKLVHRSTQQRGEMLAEISVGEANAGSSNAWAISRPPKLASSSLHSELQHE